MLRPLSTNPKEVFLQPSDHFSDGSQYIFFTELQKQKLHNCSQFFDTIASNALHRIKLFSQWYIFALRIYFLSVYLRFINHFLIHYSSEESFCNGMSTSCSLHVLCCTYYMCLVLFHTLSTY